MGKTRDLRYKKRFKFDSSKHFYEFRLSKRRCWWWLLLLLLPLLLFVCCNRDITVVALCDECEAPLPDIEVSMSYKAHFLYKDGHFFRTENVEMTQSTDEDGVTVFRDLPCSVFSYVFYCMSKATFSAGDECCERKDEKHLFHFTRKLTMRLEQRKTDLKVRTMDLETGDVIAGATVEYSYTNHGDEHTDTVMTDADGIAVIKQFYYCGVIRELHGSCYGYADTCKYDMPAQRLIIVNDSSTLRMRPIKKSFSFFVKNVDTREPVPGARAEITLTSAGTGVTRASAVTNVDGKGRGFYGEAHILAKVGIHASKIHFRDSVLVGDYTVDEFVNLPDERRVVWLAPEPYVEYFENIDSVTGDPIVGVRNVITVTDPSGNTETYTEISNRNGKFPVKAKEGSKIHIESEKSPDYEDKVTDIPSFDDAEKIRIRPNVVSVSFRTIEAESGAVLSDCNLVVSTTVSGVNRPTNSGSGVFTVDGLRYGECISITASKESYTTNNTKIRNARVNDLLTASQERRDIPLNINLPSCNAGSTYKKSAGMGSVVNKYNMGQRGGTFVLDIDAYSISDRFIVYDGGDTSCPVLFDGDVTDKKTLTLRFTQSIITIKTVTVDENSAWEYDPHCPM